ALSARTITQVRHVRVQPIFRNRGFGPIETAREIRTSRFTVTAADAPVVINDGDAIRLLPGGLYRAYLHAGRILTLLALHRHVKKAFLGYARRSVIVVGHFHVQRAMGHLQYADVLNLGVPRLVVLRDAGMHAFAATDTARQVEAINKFDAVHGFVIT